MIDYELYARIKYFHDDKGLSAAQIAQEIGRDVRTVEKWLEEKQFRPRTVTPRPSKLDPFKADIVRMLERHPYTARQIFQRLREGEDGYAGSYSILKRYVRKVRPKTPKAFLTLAFAPGECAQVDWGSYGSIRVGETSRRLSFFVMVLCYSRQVYVEFTVSQSMEQFLACHQHAFAAFNGVPQKLMIDNLKSAVIRHLVGQAPVFNSTYLDFARHYNFKIAACGVRKANEKGRVENGVGYVKKNFLAGAELPEFTAMNPAAQVWLDTVANVRIHGETHRKPAEVLAEERPHFLPLPPHPYDEAKIIQVRASSQFRVTVDTNRYSVPARFAGIPLTMKLYQDRICLYHENQLIARHNRSWERHRDFEDPDHPRELIAQRRKAKDQHLFLRFFGLSPRATDYYRQLETRHLNARRHVRNIVALADIHGAEAVGRAMDDSLDLHAVASESVAFLLESRARTLPQPAALHLTRREDLLDLEIEAPDLSIYDPTLSDNEET